MLEVIGIPVLLKAVDFLFGQARDIMAERRKRSAGKTDKAAEGVVPSHLPAVPSLPGTVIQTREDAIRAEITQAAWNRYRDRVEHLLTLIEIYSKNYNIASEQYAKWTETLVPAIVVHNLESAENNIANTASELQEVLSEIYGYPVVAPELNDGDISGSSITTK